MLVEIFYDTVCPWCYVGKRRFEVALDSRPELAVELRWRPYELNADLPVEGVDRAEYMQSRFGDVNRFAGAHAQLEQLGRDLGFEFHFDRIRRMPNTRRSHALIAYAAVEGRERACADRVMQAYFSDGLDIGDIGVLTTIAGGLGMDVEAAHLAVQDEALHAQIATVEKQAKEAGITGVPAYVFASKYLVSGAQESAVFEQVLDTVAAELAAESSATGSRDA